MSDYSEVSQLRTQCAILESQINVLQTKNGELNQLLKQLEKRSTQTFKDIPNVGKFPVDYTTLSPDDGDFQL
jgi:prefoldin subunit 5